MHTTNTQRASLFNSNLYSDVEVRCSDGTTYPAHKAIICPQSAVLANACNPNHAFKEARENVVALEQDDPATVHALLVFLYDHCYTAPADGAMLFHARMYAMAEFYQVPALKELAKRCFREEVDGEGGWADPSFALAVEVVFESTPEGDRGLRDLVVEAACRHFGELKERKEFEEVAQRIGSFSFDVAEALHRRPVLTVELKCKECSGQVKFDVGDWEKAREKLDCACGASISLSAWMARFEQQSE